MTDPAPSAAPGWYPDPLLRFEFRYFNGVRWTNDVSTGGQRYLDPVDVPRQPAGAPKRTMAIVGFLLGLGALLGAWIPFVFVAAAGAAVAALWLGITVVRRARVGRAGGRGFAVAGIVLGAAALLVAPVGYVLTAKFVREIEEYSSPGPVEAEITDCRPDGALVEIEGFVHNLDDADHDYTLSVQLLRGEREVDLITIQVDGVTAGERAEWSQSVVVGGAVTGELTCELFTVKGPFPFGLDIS